MSRRPSTSFEPKLKELIAQGKYQGYIRALEDVLDAAHTFDQGSFISSGLNLTTFTELIQKKLQEHRGKYQSRFK